MLTPTTPVMKRQSLNHGQSLVLVALMAIVLVGFVGLTIDGGNAYNQRRIAQNAADGAAIRGGQLIGDDVWQNNSDPVVRREEMLRRIHGIVELHGVQDDGGAPGDAVNGNVTAYWTNEHGVPFHDCTIDACATIPPNAFGLEVMVNHPFETYFSGVIGWSEMTVGARAIGLTKVGRTGFGGNEWALYAIDGNSCDGSFGFSDEVDYVGPSSSRIDGNSHSNGSYKITGVSNLNPVFREITYVTGYDGPGNWRHKMVNRDGLALPAFNDYFSLAQTSSQLPGGTYVPNPSTPPGYSRPTLVLPNATMGNRLGNTTTPYTFVNGDVVLTGTGSVILGGLIVVNGNVLINSTSVTYAAPGASLLATGSIQMTANNAGISLRPFQDGFNPRRFDPLLDVNIWRVVLWSNADMAAVGADPCTVPVYQDLGRGGSILGAVLAPNGMVHIEGLGATRAYNGTVISDLIYIRGENRWMLYNDIFFPPQPDFVELME